MDVRIGIIGTGNMGRTLGLLWAEGGHEVLFGARDREQGRWAAGLAVGGARYGSNDEAAAHGEVVVYTVRDAAPSAVLSSPAALSGKVLIDCNNRDIPDGFAFDPIAGESLAERLAADVPYAHVVKAFNTVAQEAYELPPAQLREQGVSCFVCGDDEPARRTVMVLAAEIGLAPVDCGPLRSARLVEAQADLVRFLMAGMGHGRHNALSWRRLPETTGQRLGGRRPSRYG